MKPAGVLATLSPGFGRKFTKLRGPRPPSPLLFPTHFLTENLIVTSLLSATVTLSITYWKAASLGRTYGLLGVGGAPSLLECRAVMDPPIPPDPVAGWQKEQPPSFACAPPLCRTNPAGGGLTKLLLNGGSALGTLWQEPHAYRVGRILQLSSVPLWHVRQFWGDWGNRTSLKLEMRTVGGTVATSTPLTKLSWLVWIPVYLIEQAGPRVVQAPLPAVSSFALWHMTQNWVSRRPPPWIARMSWQLLHAAVVTSFLWG